MHFRLLLVVIPKYRKKVLYGKVREDVREISELLIISLKTRIIYLYKNQLLLMPESGMRWC